MNLSIGSLALECERLYTIEVVAEEGGIRVRAR